MKELFALIKDMDSLISDAKNKLNLAEDITHYDGCNSSIIVTDECNLRCTYCYCTKTPLRMSWDTAKEYIDFIFKDRGKGLEKIPIAEQKSIEHRKIFEFIGGEPLLESDLMFRCIKYILEKVDALPDKHPWKRDDWECPCCGQKNTKGIRFMISTNGLLLNDPKIQKQFLDLDPNWFYIGMTLDGTKEMHDACRLKPDGSGSYDEVMRAWKWLQQNFPHCTFSTKSTISPDNLQYVGELVEYFYGLGLKSLAQNCVFENVWRRGDQLILFDQLCKVADFLLKNKRYEKMKVRWFGPEYFKRTDPTHEGKWCGAGTYMDCCDSTGQLYPCLRFKQLDQKEPFIMGNVKEGKWAEVIDKFKSCDIDPITNPRQPSLSGLKDCADCPISANCADCQAYAYDCFGSLEAKSPFICPMHKAAAVANIYFFGHLFKLDPDKDSLYDSLKEWTANDYFSTDGEYKI